MRGTERTAGLTIHHGRHTFASFALARGVSPVAVQQALGHSSLSVTNVYAHLLDDDGADGNLFGSAERIAARASTDPCAG